MHESHVCAGTHESQKRIWDLLELRVSYSCEPPDVGAGNPNSFGRMAHHETGFLICFCTGII